MDLAKELFFMMCWIYLMYKCIIIHQGNPKNICSLTFIVHVCLNGRIVNNLIIEWTLYETMNQCFFLFTRKQFFCAILHLLYMPNVYPWKALSAVLAGKYYLILNRESMVTSYRYISPSYNIHENMHNFQIGKWKRSLCFSLQGK